MSVIETYTSNKLDILDKHPSALHLDLRSNKSIDDFLRKLNKICSNIDIAIFLSGVLPGKKLDKFESSDVYEVMAVNFNVHGKLISKALHANRYAGLSLSGKDINLNYNTTNNID